MLFPPWPGFTENSAREEEGISFNGGETWQYWADKDERGIVTIDTMMMVMMMIMTFMIVFIVLSKFWFVL